MSSAAAIAAGAHILGGAISDSASAAEARRNREFQERMSNTAHQREVEDLLRAGLNPMLSAMRGGGASTPSGNVADVGATGRGIGAGVASALAVKQMQAQIELLKAQTLKTHTEAADISVTQPGRLNLTQMQALLAQGRWTEVRSMLPELIEKAKAETASITNSAARTKVLMQLDKLMIPGAVNLAKFEEDVGVMHPWMRLLFEAARGMKDMGTGPGILKRRR